MAKKTKPAKKQAAKKAAVKASVKKLSATKKKTVKKASSSAKAKKKGKGEDLMCFLTTACVHYRGLPDDCPELSTLRQYRDQYLLNRTETRAIVHEYYVIAPQIVSKVAAEKMQEQVYAYVYRRVQLACRQIEAGKLVLACQTYTGMVRRLCREFKVRARFF